MPIANKLYSDLLTQLYAATLDEVQWQHFLADLCVATRSTIAFLIRNDSTRGRQVLASAGEQLPPEFDRDYSTADPVREAFLHRPKTGVIEVEDFLPHRRLAQTAYYPLMAASGVTYGTCIVPRLSTRRFELIAIWRGDDRIRLDAGSAELLHLLYPHIQTAVRIHEALGSCHERTSNVEAIINRSTTASFVVNATGKPLYLNDAARNLLADADGMVNRDGLLRPGCLQQRSEFLTLLTKATCPNGRDGTIALKRRSGKRPLQVLVSPMQGVPDHLSRWALVLASDPEQSPRFPDETLKKLYGFTRAETELANGFLTGLSPDAIATIRGVSIETVRSQTKSLLTKTNTSRQVDLVRLLLAIPQTFDAHRL